MNKVEFVLKKVFKFLFYVCIFFYYVLKKASENL